MASYIPEGFRTLTAYPVVLDAAAFIDFLKTVFSAEEKFRTTGGAGGIHAEMRIGDSMLMLGSGNTASPMAFHISAPDVDAAYQKALQASATSMSIPTDQAWGERTANIKDPFGNYWYIGTRKGEAFTFPGMPVLQPYLHPVNAAPLIDFIKRAFGAEEDGRFTTPAGKMEHATLRIGDATIEMSEADGPYQPMPSMFYLYVPDVDAAYKIALDAGGVSLSVPADQFYGDRTAAVKDPVGNSWYMATHLPKNNSTK